MTPSPSHGAPAPELVVVGLLVHNAERTLRRSIESVLAQTHQNLRLILSDDASTDSSRALCEEFAALDSRVRVQGHDTNIGGVANFNSVVGPASDGDYFAWLSDHDIWHPEYVETCLDALREHPDAVLCYTAMHEESLDGSLVRRIEQRLDTRGLGQLSRVVVAAWAVPANTGMIYGLMRTRMVMQSIDFPDLYPHTPAPDVLLLVELASLGEFLYVDQDLYTLMNLGAGHAAPEKYMARLRLVPANVWAALRIFMKIFSTVRRRLSHTMERRRRLMLALVLTDASLLKHYGWLLPLLLRMAVRRRRR